ncbi:hypothetical protein QQW93_06615 [Pasteurella multocida]|uniref:hypothetical protein n=1 Tax=Pasteurella multocida TaxID=747 RepID=UPI0013F426FF|nr:hypothetical protein [Pasteurella multocida]MDY0489696.1 hypothetical protein [Pasteurella multocida]MDY0669962.1 hypothetical protein [Pasteurella multocida]MDY0721487.1 hypothetical protein [Pasteurella multocida]MEB4493910.1 hypothetical protein [Pasteurella multocida]MEB4501603.1 hypothetical protein [Pasteurella multocida]
MDKLSQKNQQNSIFKSIPKSKRLRWLIFEEYKQRISNIGLTHTQYEQRIRAAVKELGI